ncbi:MFS transporter [Streptodolium elevatio]
MFAGFLLVGGRLADLHGRRRMFLWGLALFCAASLAGGLATSPCSGRDADDPGAGCGGAGTATLTILTAAFPEGPGRIRALAIWTAVSFTGGAAGNLIGGLLTDALSWRSILLVNAHCGPYARSHRPGTRTTRQEHAGSGAAPIAGAKGPRRYRCADRTGRRRTSLPTPDPPAPHHRRTRVLPVFHPGPVPLAVLVRVSGICWSIEECFQAAKGYVGRHYRSATTAPGTATSPWPCSPSRSWSPPPGDEAATANRTRSG